MLKLAAMPTFRQWQAAWDCAQCRFYRRMALACAAAAVCSLLLW
jgi:hypothetical protein